MKKITLLAGLSFSLTSLVAQQKTGMFDGNEDIGNPVKKELQLIMPEHRNTL